MYEITTETLLEELGEDFERTLSELSFEKAEKEYKNMSDAERNRVFTTQIDWCRKATYDKR